MKLPQFRKRVLKIIQRNGFDEETFEAIRVRDKKYQRFKRTRLHTDHVKFKQSRNQVKKTLKKLGLPTKMRVRLRYVLGKKGIFHLIPRLMLKHLRIFIPIWL